MSTKRESFSVLVPFAGFYDSGHSAYIDYTEEQLFSGDSGEILSDKLYEMFYQNVSYSYVYSKYAEAYVQALSEELKIPLNFEEMVKPREYNFETDRLFATTDRASLARMLHAVRGERLNNKIAEWFTSRSGFISHYPNHISQWPCIDEWDHNHLGCVLSCYIDKLFDDQQIKDEQAIAEEYIDSTTIEEWLDEATALDSESAKKAARALKLNDYLRRRQERCYSLRRSA
jgi:hypothetical protein